MELNKTPITYQRASELLGVSLETVKKAVLRGVLTKLPREGLYQHVMEGQVMLFKCKLLSLSILTDNDRKLWQAYEDSVRQPVAATQPVLHDRLTHSDIKDIVGLALDPPNSGMTDLMRLVLGIVAVLGLFWLLHETNKQKVEDAIDQVVAPSDRLIVKKLLSDEDTIEYLKSLIAA